MPGATDDKRAGMGAVSSSDTVDTNICLASVEQKYGETEDGKQRWKMLLSARSTPSDMPSDGSKVYDPGTRKMLGDGIAIAHLSVMLCLEEQTTWYYDEPTDSWYEGPAYGG